MKKTEPRYCGPCKRTTTHHVKKPRVLYTCKACGRDKRKAVQLQAA